MAEALIFHYRQADNFLTRLNPNTKLVCLLSYSITVSSAPPLAVYPLFLLCLIIAAAIRLPWKEYVKESIFFLVIALLMGISACFHKEGIFSALSSSLSFLSMVLASMLLADTTMPDELSRSLGRALSHVIGKYAYILSSLMEITLSMIPVIIDSTICMYEARKARGASFFHHPVRSVSELSESILSDLIDKAEMYMDALYSRSYDPEGKRSCAPYRASDVIIICFSIAVPAACLLFINNPQLTI